MKKTVSILLFIGLFFLGKGQNLVPNYSFEIYTTCPTASGQISYAFPWYDAIPTESADYFNACSSVVGVPKHGGIGYQYSNTGNGFSGIWVFSPGANYREYLQVQMTNTLTTGSCYLVEYHVNLFNTMKYALKSVDSHFSTTAISSTGTGDVLNLTPQIKKFGNSAITDTVLWTKISGIYVASGGEKFMTIGNFSDDLNIDTINTGSSYYGSYYYIDDVSVIPIDSIIGGLPAFAGNDTSVVLGDSVLIGQQISGLNCNWYDSAGTLIASSLSGIYVYPMSSTYYVVEQTLCGNITYDTVNVNVTSVGINENSWVKEINIYPNPNNGEFAIECKSLEKDGILIEIMDVTGVKIYSEKIPLSNGTGHLDLTVSNGIYFVKITNPKTNENIVKRIVIQK